MEGEGQKKQRRSLRGVFKCDTCGATFTFKSNLNGHELDAHLLGPVTCTECCKTFDRKSRFERHKCGHKREQTRRTSHEPLPCDKPHTCEECGRTFSKPESLAAHLAAHSSPSALVCQLCNKLFTVKFKLKQHMATHLGVKFPCGECGFEYSQKDYLKRHMRLCHGGEAQGPGEGMERQAGMEAAPQHSQWGGTDKQENHTSTSDGRTHECKECGKRFTRRGILRNHLTTHSKEKAYKCEECGKTYSRKDVLAQHSLTHFAAKEMKCDHCGKVFMNMGGLRQHVVIHLPKEHKCEECGKEFGYLRSLLLHTERVHGSQEGL